MRPTPRHSVLVSQQHPYGTLSFVAWIRILDFGIENFDFSQTEWLGGVIGFAAL